MLNRLLTASVVFTGISLLFSAEALAADPFRVLVSNGMKGAMEELKPQCERAVGSPLALQFSSTAALKKRIEAGEALDATIITTEAVADLVKQGKLAGASRVDLGRSALGIGIRAGSSKPDIHTVAALKQALLNVASITYPQDGATRGFIEKMFEQMGIAAQVKPKIILAPGSGPATESVAAGKAAFVITLFSEIAPVHGVEFLGALPGEYQNYVNFTGAASVLPKNAAPAKALFACIAGSAPVLKAKGIELH
jgi:molybdate transport system substrate-binding protein